MAASDKVLSQSVNLFKFLKISVKQIFFKI